MTTPKYPTQPEPYMIVSATDPEATAACGCHIVILEPTEEDGRAYGGDGAKELYLCTLHAAAEELLEALSRILGTLPSKGPRGNRFPEAHALVRRARGQTQA